MLLNFEDRGEEEESKKRNRPIPLITSIICFLHLYLYVINQIIERTTSHKPSDIFGMSVSSTIFHFRIYQIITNSFCYEEFGDLFQTLIWTIFLGYRIENIYGSFFFLFHNIVLLFSINLLLLFIPLILGSAFYEVTIIGWGYILTGYIMIALTNIYKSCYLKCCCGVCGCRIIILIFIYAFLNAIFITFAMSSTSDRNNPIILSLIGILSGGIVGYILLVRYGSELRSVHQYAQLCDTKLEGRYEHDAHAKRCIFGFVPTQLDYLPSARSNLQFVMQNAPGDMESGSGSFLPFVDQDVRGNSAFVPGVPAPGLIVLPGQGIGE